MKRKAIIMRIGEAMALKWKDIDFNNKVVHIERALTVESDFDDHCKAINRRVVIGETKTASRWLEVLK